MTYQTIRPYGGGTIAGRIRIDGRFFVNDAGTFRPVFQSGLSLLARTPGERAKFLDETVALGFNGIRVFCGDLGWAGQTPTSARAVLPTLLDEVAARGLYVYTCAITGGKDPFYDVEAHLRSVVDICRGRANVLLEGANEIGHSTLADACSDIPNFLAMMRDVVPDDMTWTLGAPVWTDEPTPEGTYPTDGGHFNDAHLDRGRDFWNQVRRVREIYAIYEATRVASMSGEPIGADEQNEPSRREADPTFFWTLGLLCRGFEVGGVFHSQYGLDAVLAGPNQRTCAQEYISGGKAIPTSDRLEFINAGWTHPVSPVTSFDSSRVVRCYSFVTGGRGWTALIGLKPDPNNPGGVLDPRIVWGGGWAPAGVVAERIARDGSRIQLVEITQ